MLLGPGGAKHSALGLYKSINKCSSMHQELWGCIQDAPSRIIKFWSSCDRWAGLQETSTAAETSVQLCRRLGAMLSQQ